MPNEKTPNPHSTFLSVEVLEARTVPAMFGATQGLSIAVGDVIPGVTSYEYVRGSGPGQTPLVIVSDSQGIEKFRFNPFSDTPAYTGGVFVALGDVNLDGQKEILCATAGGTTGRVRVYQFRQNSLQPLADFQPFGPNYLGGVQIAGGNVSGDRADEIVVGLMRNGSTVKVFSVDPASTGTSFFETRKIRGFEVAYKGGVSLAVSNVDQTPNNFASNPYNFDYEEVILGKSAGEPRIRIVDVQLPASNTRANYLAFNTDPSVQGSGVQIAAGSTNGRRGAELYVNPVNTTRVEVLDPNIGVRFGEFSVPFPPTYGVILNMAINDRDGDVFDVAGVSADLFIVAGDGSPSQIPVVFPGKLDVAAGFNNFRFAP